MTFHTFTPSDTRPRRPRIATAKRLRAGPLSLILFSLGAKMVIFTSEPEITSVLDRADEMIAACVEGSLDFHSFHQQLADLHGCYALDGHESDAEERAILERHRGRIAWIERILKEVGAACADEDASKPAYIEAGRFGSDEALRRLRHLVQNASTRTA